MSIGKIFKIAPALPSDAYTNRGAGGAETDTHLGQLARMVGQLQAQIGNMGYNPQRGEPAGFFDLKPTCRDANHTPPYGIYVPPGKGYRHVCPGCGFSFEIRGS